MRQNLKSRFMAVLVSAIFLTLFSVKSLAANEAADERGATQWDVAACGMLAEEVAIVGWNLKTLLNEWHALNSASHIPLTKLLESKNVEEALLLLLRTFEAKLEKKLIKYTLGEFWDLIVIPQLRSCRNVGVEFLSAGEEVLPVFLSRKDFFTSKVQDSPGIKHGRTCAQQNLGLTPWNLLGGGFDGCAECCDRRYDVKHFATSHGMACVAVCHAQFD